MSRALALAVGGGAISALLTLSAFAVPGGILFAQLSQLPLFLVGFGVGLVPGAIACGAGTVVLALAVPIHAAGPYVLSSALPVAVLIGTLLQSRRAANGTVEWYPTGYALSWLAVLGAAYVVVAALFLAGAEGGIEGAGSRWILGVLKVVMPQLPPADMQALSTGMAPRLPAAVIASGMFLLIVNATLAQALLVRLGRNIRSSTRLTDLELPGWLAPGLAVAAATSLISGQVGMVGQNLALILAIPFLFLGLAVIHALAQRWQGRGLILILLYLLLIFLGWPAILVAGIGFAEQWAQLRRRFAGTPRGRGKE